MPDARWYSAMYGGRNSRVPPSISPSPQPEVLCPICMNFASQRVLETFYGYVLHECSGCRLQFWNPRKMPDARWYSAMYGGRNSRVLPLESGHHFFLADALAPRRGRLLAVG